MKVTTVILQPPNFHLYSVSPLYYHISIPSLTLISYLYPISHFNIISYIASPLQHQICIPRLTQISYLYLISTFTQISYLYSISHFNIIFVFQLSLISYLYLEYPPLFNTWVAHPEPGDDHGIPRREGKL